MSDTKPYTVRLKDIVEGLRNLADALEDLDGHRVVDKASQAVGTRQLLHTSDTLGYMSAIVRTEYWRARGMTELAHLDDPEESV